MDLPATLPALHVESELRYNLFLALKETLNNIVKHAHASEVWLRLRTERDGFTLVVEDNGQGLPAARAVDGGDRISSGHGLPNLEGRLAAIGGRYTVDSAPGRGTRVEMTLHVKDEASPILATGRNGPG
jgi:signal transduction histidine kinase